MEKKLQPQSSHSSFFSSLKQVEKRLKLDRTSPPPPESSKGSLTLNSPMFLDLDQTSCSQNRQYSSEPPQAFLSVSPDFPPNPSQTSPSDHLRIVDKIEDDGDDIGRLMQLLGLSEEQRNDFEDGDCDSCHCEGGFYSKIVGVEGPKCRKEVLRLDGWIRHFMNGGVEKQEPLRLAHLLLGKAAFVSADGGGGGGGFGVLEFPSTIQEFLHIDPPPSN